MTQFSGIYAATLVPMLADGRIDENALCSHIAALADSEGLSGFLINGHAGENHQLSRQEKRRIVEIAKQHCGGRQIVAGVNHEDSQMAAREAEDAATAGADAIMVFPPMSWALGHDPDMVRRHHSTVAGACDAPLFLYQAPVGAGRLAYSFETLDALIDLPSVMGIKEGSWETARYEANRRFIRERAPHIGVYASGDEHLFTCFVLGSEGSLVSLAAIWPEPIVELERAVVAGDLEKARDCHNKIYPLARAIYGTAPGYWANARLKTCLRLLGRFPDDRLRAPIERLPDDEVEGLKRLLSNQGLLN